MSLSTKLKVTGYKTEDYTTECANIKEIHGKSCALIPILKILSVNLYLVLSSLFRHTVPKVNSKGRFRHTSDQGRIPQVPQSTEKGDKLECYTKGVLSTKAGKASKKTEDIQRSLE